MNYTFTDRSSIGELPTIIKSGVPEDDSKLMPKYVRQKWTSNSRLLKFNSSRSLYLNQPDEVLQMSGNTALFSGLEILWRLVNGQGRDDNALYYLDAFNTFIGVGNSSSDTSPEQTRLMGVKKAFQGMDRSSDNYPLINKNVMTVRSVFGPDQANFIWNEWGVYNGNPSNYGDRDPDTIVCFNRKVESMGAKQMGTTWIIIADLIIHPN